MSDAEAGRASRAIALTPILAARYRARDLERIAAAAQGSRLVSVSHEGFADGPLDDVEVLLSGFTGPGALERVVARSPSLRWIHSASAGVERVSTLARSREGLLVTNARGVFSRPVAEYVAMMVLVVCRRLPQLAELQRERTWQPLEGRELRDVTVGVVGLGSLGREIAVLLLALGARVVATRRRAEGDAPPVGVEILGGAEALPALLAASDFVVLATPLTPDTDGLIGADEIEAMRSDAWLVNVSRGRLVDEAALLRGLEERSLGGAVLDAFRDEPLAPDSPFWAMPNVLLTPHTSWSTDRVLDRSIDLFCENLVRYRRGEPLANRVDPEAGY